MTKLGVYLDLRNPPAWRRDWNQLYGFTLELCEEAERLGADSVWLSEHHGFEDGYLTQPLTFASAIAARTRRIRIGTAVVIAPFRDPVQLAEEATIIDIVSNGRLDLGLGAGYRLPEFELFAEDMSARYRATDDVVRRLRALWGEARLTPPPVQAPLPIWMGYQGPKGARRCGLLGEHLLSVDPSLLAPYRDGLVAGGHDPASARMSGFVSVYATHDVERDWPVVGEHLRYQVDSYRRYGVEGTGRPAPRPMDPERARANRLGHGLMGIVVDSPTVVAQAIAAETAGLPVDTVFAWVSIAGMPDTMVLEHLTTLCTEVAPLLADPAAATEPSR
jgi:alkanesulfonate monooxygenase SsuD/methylene tetrahydromethanopterin reductase-like flavin-dependent oxidoreductase (luciferase family)